jgi:hypothetical protein
MRARHVGGQDIAHGADVLEGREQPARNNSMHVRRGEEMQGKYIGAWAGAHAQDKGWDCWPTWAVRILLMALIFLEGGGQLAPNTQHSTACGSMHEAQGEKV